MSRQRLRESSIKWKISLTNETFALKIIKLLEIQIIDAKAKIIDLKLCDQVCKYIENNLKDNIKYVEKKYKVKINLLPDNQLIIPDYIIELKNKSKKIINTIENISKLEVLNRIEEDNKKKTKNPRPQNKFKRKKFHKKKFFKKKLN